MILVIFGYPGSGKTYIANILKKHFDFYVFDGDSVLPERMKQALSEHAAISDDMRDEFFSNIEEHTKFLLQTHTKLIISQTFIKEKYRKHFLQSFPQAQFLYVVCNNEVREKRLAQRVDYPLDNDYANQMIRNFDNPLIPHKVIENSIDGEEEVKKQLQEIFSTT